MQKQKAHIHVQAVVLGEGLQQLRAQLLIKEHHFGAGGHGVAKVQAAAALLGQPDQVGQPLPLELAPAEQHLRAAPVLLMLLYTSIPGSQAASVQCKAPTLKSRKL